MRDDIPWGEKSDIVQAYIRDLRTFKTRSGVRALIRRVSAGVSGRGGVIRTSANFFAERPDRRISGVSGIPLHCPDTPALTLVKAV